MNTMNTGRQQQQQYQQQQFNTNNMSDSDQVRRTYKSALSELTFNSKPIITNLTIMAQQNLHASNAIVSEIEHQLRNNAAGQKLPILYLIDSICKNVGGVYITHFARNMVNNFLDAYTLSDPTVRKSFERLLQTWKNGMPGNLPVFSRHVIESIERSIHYIQEKTPTSRYPHVPPSSKPSTTSAPLLPTTSTTTTTTTTTINTSINNPNIHVNPNFLKDQHRVQSKDPRNRSPQITEVPQLSSSTLLSQLQSMLPTASNQLAPQSYSANDPVSQIIRQIKAMLPTLPPAQAKSIEQYLSQIAAASPTPHTATIATPSPTLNNPTLSFPPSNLTTLSPSPAPTTFASQPKVLDTADLLKSLTSMGYLKTEEKPTVRLDQFGPFLLDSKDLQISRPGAIELLYSAEPLQCKQCGFRYPKTDKGQAKMDAHLDSHFRQNRKMKERSKRGLSRSWFVTVDEWITGEGGELTSQQAPAFLHDQTSKSNENQANHEQSINPDQNTVIMPNQDSRKPCPICGERFIDFWNDDEEEWMYKNAVIVKDKIYHATCYADAIQSGALANIDSDMQDVHNNLKRKINQDDEQTTKQPRLE